MTHMYRRCSKCGATQASNPELRMHRFPALSQNNENFYQLLSWALFCEPEKDWFDLEAIAGLQKSGKVLCSRHFDVSAYTSPAMIRLQKFAMPSMDENKENQNAPTAGPSRDHKHNVLVEHGQIITEQSEMPSTIKKNQNTPTAGPSHDYKPNVLAEYGQIKEQSKMPSTSDHDQIMHEQQQGMSKKMTSMPSVSKKRAYSQPKNVQKLSSSETKMYNKYKYLLKKIRMLKTGLKRRKSIDVLQMLHGNEHVNKLLNLKISPSMALLLQGELQNGQRRHPGRRWNEKQKFLALELYKKSPRTYKLLSRLFCLPSPSTLRRLLGQFSLKPGINKVVFENIKKSAKKNTATDNLCILTFDEMSIMKNITITQKRIKSRDTRTMGIKENLKNFAPMLWFLCLYG